jgi:hypothetical protein
MSLISRITTAVHRRPKVPTPLDTARARLTEINARLQAGDPSICGLTTARS